MHRSLRAHPSLRGRLHQVAAIAAVPAGTALVLVADGPRARLGVLVYAVALVTQFGASAAYHLGRWSGRARQHMQRLDHSTIFVLIAGTYTPFALLVLEGPASIAVLAAVWAGAAAGVATKLYRTDLHVLSGFLYIGLGWAAVFVLPTLVRELSGVQLALIVIGGLTYSLGALVLALKRPNPWPRVFGYHEVWHTATIVAAGCLYVAVLLELLHR
jgi:hemolysin III